MSWSVTFSLKLCNVSLENAYLSNITTIILGMYGTVAGEGTRVRWRNYRTNGLHFKTRGGDECSTSKGHSPISWYENSFILKVREKFRNVSSKLHLEVKMLPNWQMFIEKN